MSVSARGQACADCSPDNSTVGIGAGFIAYVVINLVRGKVREIHGLMWLVAALFVVYLVIDPVRQLLGVA